MDCYEAEVALQGWNQALLAARQALPATATAAQQLARLATTLETGMLRDIARGLTAANEAALNTLVRDLQAAGVTLTEEQASTLANQLASAADNAAIEQAINATVANGSNQAVLQVANAWIGRFASNVRFGLIGVSDSQASALARVLRTIQVEGESAVVSVEAFGSRAGSTYRGPATPTSDLDIFVTLNSSVVNSPAKLAAVRAQLDELRLLFNRSTGFELNIVPEIDAIAPAVRRRLLETPFIRLE